MKPSLLAGMFKFGHLSTPVPAPRAEEEDKKDGTDETEKKEGAEDDKEKDGKADDDEDEDGSDENKEATADAKAAFRRGAKAEKVRIGHILSSAEAGGNPSLAAHLACNTDLSVAAAIGSLKVSPAAPKGNALAAAMAANPTASLGVDGGKSPQGEVQAGWDNATKKVNARTNRAFGITK